VRTAQLFVTCSVEICRSVFILCASYLCLMARHEGCSIGDCEHSLRPYVASNDTTLCSPVAQAPHVRCKGFGRSDSLLKRYPFPRSVKYFT
jgi:hypothetical protein